MLNLSILRQRQLGIRDRRYGLGRHVRVLGHEGRGHDWHAMECRLIATVYAAMCQHRARGWVAQYVLAGLGRGQENPIRQVGQVGARGWREERGLGAQKVHPLARTL